MGNHRAERRGPSSRRPSETPHDSAASGSPASEHYVGRRVAKRAVDVECTTVFHDLDLTAELPLVTAEPGKRRAVKHMGSRGSLFKALPSAPILLGVVALAVSAGGAVTAVGAGAGAGAGAADSGTTQFSQASALSGASGVSSFNLLENRAKIVSRDSRRDALADAADADLVAEAEAKARQRNAALTNFAQQAEKQAAKIALNQWQLPVTNYRLTARFGDYGLWATYHTGLDFAAPTGTPIYAIANGIVTSAAYDGSYGNKTVMTLEDGTELWYCHQNAFATSEGDVVRAGQLIGYIGSTGHVTGPHLHLEVRPGGGDPVDPYAALVAQGLTP